VSPEAVLALGYALFLVAAATALDLLARHANRRSHRFRTAGFIYHEHLDAWECPEGQHLRRVEDDLELRLVRYRGTARICNACRVKESCTDSDEGREVVRSLEEWTRSEAGRFHRAISLVLVSLAALIVAVAAARNHRPSELAAFTALAALIAVAGVRLGRSLTSPSATARWGATSPSVAREPPAARSAP
jgi:hypothetical protein